MTKFPFIHVDEPMLDEAQRMAKNLGVLRNSIREGKGNLVGSIGELAFIKYLKTLGYESRSNNTYQHDLIAENCTFEVKTKDRTVPPRRDYEASVASFNPNQKADFYVFVSVHRVGSDYKTAYICGIVETDVYKKVARFLRKGEVDPSNNFTVKADCYNLSYDKLYPFV